MSDSAAPRMSDDLASWPITLVAAARTILAFVLGSASVGCSTIRRLPGRTPANTTAMAGLDDGIEDLVPLRPESTDSHVAGSEVRLDLFRGEVEAFQVVLTPRDSSASLTEVQIVFEPLVDGDQRIDPTNLEWFKVGYFNEDRPDVLLPVPSFDTFAEGVYNHPVWIRVKIPRETKPGHYRGRLRIAAAQGEVASIPLEVKVWQTVIPRQARFNTMFFGFWTNHVAFHLGLPEISQETRDILIEGAEMLADHRITHDSDGIGAIPYYPPMHDRLSPEGQEEVMRWCDFWTSRGLRLSVSFRVMNSRHYAEEPDRVEHARRFYAIYAPLLRERGWADMVYTIIDDEYRGVDAAKRATATALFLKSLMPELTIAATGGTNTRGRPEQNVDAYKIAAQAVTTWATDMGYNMGPFSAFEPAPAAEKVPKFLFERAAAGDRIWPYIHGALDFTQDGYTIRSFFWQLSAYGFDGTCLYSVTDWGREEKNLIRPHRFGLAQAEALSWPPPGVGALFWPGEQRLLESVRLEQVRDGIEDWECYRMLDERLIRAQTQSMEYAAWIRQAEEALQLRSEQVSPITKRPSWGVFEHRADQLFFAHARKELGEALDATPAELRHPEDPSRMRILLEGIRE